MRNVVEAADGDDERGSTRCRSWALEVAVLTR